MTQLRLVATILFWLAGAGVAVAACGGDMPRRAERTAVPASNIDHGLLDAAFRAEVNRHRCANGLSALKAARPMTGQALGHSRWMAAARNLAHDSNVRGKRKLIDRLKASGVRFRTGSENIGHVPRYRIDGGRFQVEDAGSCRFSRGGQSLPAHSYASLARHAVRLWMESPSHRRNILDPKVRQVASAAAFDSAAPHCGRFWMTQNFVG